MFGKDASCPLFCSKLYSEYILRRVGFEDNIGIKVGGRTINNLRYADDATIFAEDKEDMRKLLEELKEEHEKARLMLNLKKTKVITTGILNEFILDGTEMEIIYCYTFLGSIITSDGYVYKEINRRLLVGRIAVNKTGKNYVKKATKIKIAVTIIFPTVIYGSESWTVREKERKKIYAFQLQTWRRILQVPWTERKMNLSVLEKMKPKRSLEATIL